jgi:putative ABC transport system permease protein
MTLVRRLRRLALGAAGPGLASAIMLTALVTAFVAAAGPRMITTAQTSAVRQAVAATSDLDRTISVTGYWPIGGGTDLGPQQVNAMLGRQGLPAALRPPMVSPPSLRWAGVTTPDTAPDNQQELLQDGFLKIELGYRSNLLTYARLVSGTLPDAVTLVRPGRPGPPSEIIFQVAATQATAAYLHLRPGSSLDLGSYGASAPMLVAQVTGILRPAAPASAFWQVNPQLAAPLVTHTVLAGFIIGPAELAAVPAAYPDGSATVSWSFPLDLGGLTDAQLPALLSEANALTSSASETEAEQNLGMGFLAANSSISCDLPLALGSYLSESTSVGAIDSLLLVGIFVAGLILLLVCALLAADAYRGELTMLRARGGATAQVAARMLARTGCLAGPGLIAGVALAVVLGPSGGNRVFWLLAGATAVVALTATPIICAWRTRRTRPAAAGRADLVITRQSARATVAEAAILIAAVGGLIAVSRRGLGTSNDLYLSASPVLAAAAAALVVARGYRVPVGALLAAAAPRRGPVGFVGLARTARSRFGQLLPALVLVLTMTLAAFGIMIAEAIGNGQSAAAWQQVGADVMIQRGGMASFTAGDEQAVSGVPGVRQVAAIYTATGGDAAQLAAAGQTGTTANLVVVDPGPYARLASETPWPTFPASALSRGSGGGGAVPVIVSPNLAGGAGGAGLHLVLDGVSLPVRIAGTIAATPAMPGGGTFVVLPYWAAPGLPSIPPPETLLVTGSSINQRALAATVARSMPGSQVTVRQQVLSGLAANPALVESERLYPLAILAAIAFSAIAVLFGLAAAAGERRLVLTRLAALGMSARQALALAVSDALPLLSVAVIGTVAAGIVLALVIGPVLDLGVFTGGSVLLAGLQPELPFLLVPCAAMTALAVVILTADGIAWRRRDVAAALRQEEAD